MGKKININSFPLKKRVFLVFIVLVFTSTILCFPLIQPQQATAEVPGTGNNVLQLVGQHCHDLKSITHVFPDIGSNYSNASAKCHNEGGALGSGGKDGWEETLQKFMGCSGNMFYEFSFKDDKDSSVTTQKRWYTRIGAYKGCYENVQTMFNNMTNPNGQCPTTVAGSQNFQNCRTDVNNLHNALGCSTHMLKKTGEQNSNGSNYYTVDPNDPNVKNCQQRIDDVGKVHLYIPVPGPNVRSKKMDKSISDPSITVSTPDPDGGSAGGAGGAGEGQGTEEIKCEASFFTISWIICATIEFGANFTNWFFNSFLRPLLEDVPVSLDPAEGSFRAWQGFRLLANIMLVASMLAIVYAQARGDQ